MSAAQAWSDRDRAYILFRTQL